MILCASGTTCSGVPGNPWQAEEGASLVLAGDRRQRRQGAAMGGAAGSGLAMGRGGGIRANTAATSPAVPLPGALQTTAPSSGPESRGGRSPMCTTSVANPPMKAATAQNAAQPGTCQSTMTAMSR